LRRSITVLLLVAALTAVSAAQEPIVLRMFSGYSNDGTPGYAVLDPYLRMYEAMNPHVRIENMGREHDMDKVITMFVGGEGPDIVEGGTIHLLRLYNAGLLATVPSRLADRLHQEIFPISVQSLTIDGRLIGVPVENMTTGLVYNKLLLNESGYGEPPRDVAEFEEMGRRLSRYDDQSVITRPGAADPGEGWTLHYQMLAMLKAEGGQVLDADRNLALDSAATHRVFQMFYDWAGGPARDGFLGLGWHWYEAFNMGDVPMMFGFPWYLGNIQSAYDGDFVRDFGAVPLPAGSQGVGAMHYGHGYGVSSMTPHADEAWKLLEWLSLVQGDQGITPLGHTMAAIGSLPLAQADLAAPHFADQLPVYHGFIESLADAWSETAWAEVGVTYVNIGYEFLPVLNGEKSIVQGVADLVLKNVRDMEEYQRTR